MTSDTFYMHTNINLMRTKQGSRGNRLMEIFAMSNSKDAAAADVRGSGVFRDDAHIEDEGFRAANGKNIYEFWARNFPPVITRARILSLLSFAKCLRACIF